MADIYDTLKAPKLGALPKGVRKKTPEEMAAQTATQDANQALIGGKGSSAVGSFLGNVVEGAASVLTSPLKAADEVATGIYNYVTDSDVDASTGPFTKLGEDIEGLVGRVAQGDPERDENFSSKLGQGLGSAAGFMTPLGLMSKASTAAKYGAVAGLGGAASGVEGAEDYAQTVKKQGLEADPSDRAAAFFYNGVFGGATEALPIARMFGRLDDVVKGGLSAAVKNTAKGTAEEALQEGLQNTVSNLVASDLVRYDPDRDMYFDTAESATVGGGVGFIVNAAMNAIGLRQRGKFEALANKVAKDGVKATEEDVKEAASTNPVTGQPIATPDIAKTNLQILRLEKLVEANPSAASAAKNRIAELKKSLSEKYVSKEDADALTKQEAEDVIKRMGITEAPAEAPAVVAEADPFPTTAKGIGVRELTGERSLKQANKLFDAQTPEEITIDQIPQEAPAPAGDIGVEEVQPEIEEITAAPAPVEPEVSTFFQDKPANTALADALKSIQGKEKLREETNMAYEARKAEEVKEAYRQYEMQRAKEVLPETQEEIVQPTTPEPINAPAPQQAEETVRRPKAQARVGEYRAPVNDQGRFNYDALSNEKMSKDFGVGAEYKLPDKLTSDEVYAYGIDKNVEDHPQHLSLAKKIIKDNPGFDFTADQLEESGLVGEFLQGVGSEFNVDDINLYITLLENGYLPAQDLGNDPQYAALKARAEAATNKQINWVPSIPTLEKLIGEPISQPTQEATNEQVADDMGVDQGSVPLDQETLDRTYGFTNTAKEQAQEALDNIPDLPADVREFLTTRAMGLPVAEKEVIEFEPEKFDKAQELIAYLRAGKPIAAIEEEVIQEFGGLANLNGIYSAIESGEIARAEEQDEVITSDDLIYAPITTEVETAVENTPLEQKTTEGPAPTETTETPRDPVANSDETYITTKNGTPFKSERAAKAARTRYGYGDDVSIKQVGEGQPGGLQGYVLVVPNGAVQEVSNVRKTKSENTEKPELIVTDMEEKIYVSPEVYDMAMQIVAEIETAKSPSDALRGRLTAINDTFGSVAAMTQLVEGIHTGLVLPAKLEEIQQTPVGAVPNTTITNPEPEPQVPAKSREEVVAKANQVNADIDDVSAQIFELEELKDQFGLDKEEIQQLARLKKTLKSLENQQIELRAEDQAAKKSEENEAIKAAYNEEVSEFDDNVIELEDDFSGFDGIIVEDQKTGELRKRGPIRPAELNMLKGVVNKFKSSISDTYTSLEIVPVSKKSDIPEKYQRYWETNWAEGRVRGVHLKDDITGKSTVLLFGREGYTKAQYEWTIWHEVVGHYGFKRIFGNQFNQFKELMLKNKDIASKAYALRTQWDTIDLTPKSKEDTMYVLDKYTRSSIKGGPQNYSDSFWENKTGVRRVAVSKQGMMRLGEEYISEIAGDLSRSGKPNLGKTERGIVTRFITWIRHLLRKSGFGSIAGKITDHDLYQLARESYTNLTDPIAQQNNLFKDVDLTKPIEAGNLSPLALEINAMMEDVIVEGAANGLYTEADARAVSRSIDSREGRVDNSRWQRTIENATDTIRRSWVGKHLSSLGHAPHPTKFNYLENVAKGGMENATKRARIWNQKTRKLNDVQNKALYDYFLDPNGDHTALPVPADIQALAFKEKKFIEDAGAALVALGKMSPEVYEKNKGAYLPIRYYKYLDTYYATGKKTSFQDYLKKQKDIPEAERQALGQIKDVSFLVAETVATLGRDVSLHVMFKNMVTMNRVNGLGWIMGDSQFIKVGDKKMSLSNIEDEIERLEGQLQGGEGLNPLYLDQAGIAEIERQLTELRSAQEEGTAAMRQEIQEAIRANLGPDVEITEDMINQYLKANYVQVKDKRYGALYRKFVRKELYEDIVESGDMYSQEHTDFFKKHFVGQGSTLERSNQYWKAGKVVMNPPSWFRNGVGNFVLMDIGTNTSSVKLFKMMAEEINAMRRGEMTKFAKWAHDYGLYNTTYSAAELNLIGQQARDVFKSELTSEDAGNGPFKQFWWMFHKNFHKSLEWATNFYGGMEGFFKTVALRDHIEIWEKQTGQRIDQAENSVREAVIREGVESANKNIFDYSKIPGWMRTMRRMPFLGAPFLTYTFKAIPQSIESLARRPQKFIKYAMFPTVMAQMFLMANPDMDEEDMEEIQRSMPKWMKSKSSIFLLPTKDANGKWQAMDFGYYLPWATLHNMYLEATKTFDVHNPAMSAGAVTLNTFTNLGFLGGPIPAMISGVLSNKDPFSGREIIRTAGTPGDKANDLATYMIDLWMPTFLTSKGVMGRTMDNLGMEASPINSGRELTSYGSDRETGIQASLRGAGVNIYGMDVQENTATKVKAYRFEKSKLTTQRRAVIKDRNLSQESKALKLAQLNQQIKLLAKKHREEMFGE